MSPEGAGTFGGQNDLDERIAQAVEEYVKVAPPPGDTASVDPELLNHLIGRLDNLYWQKAADVLAARLDGAAPGTAVVPFTDDDRVLLDFGILDSGLIIDVDTTSFRERLLSERSERPPEDLSVSYLSSWLDARFRYLLTIEEVGADNEAARLVQSSPGLHALIERRNRLLDSLRPYMRHLPGVAEALSRLVAEGRLDDLMLRLFLERLRNPGDEVDRRLFRLEAAYRYVMHRLAERMLDESYLRIIDEYAEVRMETFRRVNRLPKDTLEAPFSLRDEDRVKRQLIAELKLVRSLLHLGTATSGISRPHSVLLRDIERATPSRVADVLALVRDADPRLALHRHVLIAPFTGNGFFEWDRDTLVVSLIPVRSVEEDVVTAVASLRIALDQFQQNEELKRAYQKAYPGADFRETFIKDYAAWVLKVARGQTQHMRRSSFDLFMQHIGHNGVDPVPLYELTGLTVAERDQLYKDILARVRDKSAGPNDLLVAGVIRWRTGDYPSASRYMEEAAHLAPVDGRILYSLGILLRNMRQRGTARRYLLQCTRDAAQSIWKVYSFEALRRLGG